MRHIILISLLLLTANLFAQDISHVIVYYTEDGSNKTLTVNAGDEADISRDHGSQIDVRVYKTNTAPNPSNFYVSTLTDGGEYQETSSNDYVLFLNIGSPTTTAIWCYVNSATGIIRIYVTNLTAEFPDLYPDYIRVDNSSFPDGKEFMVGETVEVEAFIRNIGGATAPSSRTGFYIGNSPNDFSERFGYRNTGILDPNVGIYQRRDIEFIPGDVGTKYINIWADYRNDVDEGPGGDENNKKSWGPFTVISQPPQASVNPSSYNFGEVVVGETKDFEFQVTNTGGGTLTGSASVSAPFSIVAGEGYSITQGQSHEVKVRFSPTELEKYQNVPVTFSAFSGGEGTTAYVSGEGVSSENDNFSATIIEYKVNSIDPEGYYTEVNYGETIEVEAGIENTSPESTESKTFYLLLSFSREGEDPEYYLPVQPLHLSPNGFGAIIYSFPIPHLLEPKEYNLNISIWDDFDENEPDITEALSPNPETGLPYDEWESLPAFVVDPGELVPNPFSIAHFDYINIYENIPKRHRNKGMPDLEAYDDNNGRSLMVVDRSGGGFNTRELNQNDENIIIILHGWMPPKFPWESGYADYIYNGGDKWPTLLGNLNHPGVIDDSWSIVEYDWFNDAHVSMFSAYWPVTKQDQSVYYSKYQKEYYEDEAKKVKIDYVNLYITAKTGQYVPIIAAYRGYQHGLMIARKLWDQVGLHNLSNVQIISHSAGAWANLALTQYLGNQLNLDNPEFNLQSIYLDPFIPDNLTLHDVDYMSSDQLQSTSLFTLNDAEYQGAQAYYNTGGIENTPILIGPATIVDWEWPLIEGVRLNTDFYSNHAPSGTNPHDVPIYYYAHSAINPEESLFDDAGWKKSLAYKYIQEELDPDPEDPYIVLEPTSVMSTMD